MEFYIGSIDFDLWIIIEDDFEPPKGKIVDYFQEANGPLLIRRTTP